MANGTAMIASVRSELGVLNDAALTDARIVDYFNEGQALMLPDVTRTLQTTLTVFGFDDQTALPSDFVRVVKLMGAPDQDSVQRIPPYVLIDGFFQWLDAQPRQSSVLWLIYEAKHSTIANSGTTISLPDPGGEALVSFACFRWVQRLVGDRDAYKRYSTQVGTNVVAPEDLERLAEVWHERYLQARALMAVRTRTAAALDIASF